MGTAGRARTTIDTPANTLPVNWRRWVTRTWRTTPKQGGVDGNGIFYGESWLRRKHSGAKISVSQCRKSASVLNSEGERMNDPVMTFREIDPKILYF